MDNSTLLSELQKVAMVGAPPKWIRDWIFLKRYPELAAFLIEATPECPPEVTYQFRFQLLEHGLIYPTCPTCGNRVHTFKYQYCNKKCSNNAPHRIEEQRLAAVSNFHSTSARKRAKETCQTRYGADTPFQSQEVQARVVETLQEQFGGKSAMCSREILEKSRKSWEAKTPEDLEEIAQKKRSHYDN